VGLALVADAELFRLEGLVRWLDAADSRLSRAPAPAPDTVPRPPVRDATTRRRPARASATGGGDGNGGDLAPG
jgi:hypothetical protein